MTSTTEQGTVTVTLTVEEWHEVHEAIEQAFGSESRIPRQTKLWGILNNLRTAFRQQEA